MGKTLILGAAAAMACGVLASTSLSAAVILDPIPFDIPGGLGQQVHSSSVQTGQTVFGFLSPGAPLGVTFESSSSLQTNGSGHAFVEGPFDALDIFFTNGELFNAVEFNIAALGTGQTITSGVISYFIAGSNVASGSFGFDAGSGNNKIRLYGSQGELFSRISFDATNGAYASVRQVDFGGISAGAIPEPSAWAMIIAGFAVMGGAVRASRKRRSINFAIS